MRTLKDDKDFNVLQTRFNQFVNADGRAIKSFTY